MEILLTWSEFIYFRMNYKNVPANKIVYEHPIEGVGLRVKMFYMYLGVIKYGKRTLIMDVNFF